MRFSRANSRRAKTATLKKALPGVRHPRRPRAADAGRLGVELADALMPLSERFGSTAPLGSIGSRAVVDARSAPGAAASFHRRRLAAGISPSSARCARNTCCIDLPRKPRLCLISGHAAARNGMDASLPDER